MPLETVAALNQMRHLRRWGSRIERGPAAWSLLTAALFFSASLLGLPPLWSGMLLVVPLVVFATGLGWQHGALLVPAAVLAALAADGLLGAIHDPVHYAGIAASGAVAVAAGQNLFAHWRRAERRARSNERRAELLSRAAKTLHLTASPADLYRELTRLIAAILDVSHTAVLVPRDDELELVATHLWDIEPGYRLSLDSVCGAAFRARNEVYVPDTQMDPRYVPPPRSPVTRSELAVPLIVADEVVAILNLEHLEVGRFNGDERGALGALTQIAEEALGRIRAVDLLEQQRSEQEFLARLNHGLVSAESTRQVSDVVLEQLMDVLNIDSGAVFTVQGARFHAVSDVGDIPPDVRRRIREAGLPWGSGQIYGSWLTHEPVFVTDYQAYERAAPEHRASGLRAVAFVPILNAQGRTQALLELGSFARAHAWSDRDRALLGIVANSVGVAFERAVVQEQMVNLLEIVRGLAQTDDPRRLYQDAVKAAVRLIPGAEAGSILVRSGDVFRFAATHGFDDAVLRENPPFAEAEQLRWYAGSVENFRAGIPRLATGADVRRHSEESRRNRLDDLISSDGRMAELCANICVPITFMNDVTGILNVDNLTHEGAFGVSDLRLAEAFGQQIGVIIRQTEYREALERSVVTDPLTGLGNREGFNRQLTMELARAKRYGHAVNLVMMDLDGFKAINDRYGHHAGDEALIRIAEGLERERREGDSAFRWGGDEFALIIPQVGPVDARRAAERYAAAVEGTDLYGPGGLTVSVGIASYPQEAADRDDLLRIADDLMYARKKTRIGPSGGARTSY